MALMLISEGQIMITSVQPTTTVTTTTVTCGGVGVSVTGS